MPNNILNSFFETPQHYQFHEPDEKSFKISSKGNSNVLILLNSNNMENTVKDLLAGILKAIDTSLKDVILVEVLNQSAFSFAQLKRSTKFNHVLCFGIDPENLGFTVSVSKYRMYKFEDFSLILSDGLATLSQDNIKKKRLWQQLKQHFIES